MYKAAWLLPSLLEGSGGHRTILQNAEYLCKMGFSCDLYIEDDGAAKNRADAARQVEAFFGKSSCGIYLGYDVKDHYDIMFATAWFTAKVVRDYAFAKKKAYFIQDFEALFNQMGDGYLMACNSYYYGLQPVTIGRWLSNMMQTEYHMPSQYFDFCYDARVYKELGTAKENAVCFIYQPEKPRRCHMLGIEALGIVKHLRPDIKIYLYGSKQKGNIWFEHENLGLLSLEACNALYNRCRAGLCLSSSNPSRIPFEMMAAGLPVVDLHMPNNLYDMSDGAVMLAHHTPESIAEAVIRLCDDTRLREAMSREGRAFIKDRTLEYGYEQFYRAVERIIAAPEIPYQEINRIYNGAPVIAPVFAAGAPIAPIPVAGNTGPSLLRQLKQNRFIRRSKLLRKIWALLKNL